ncbi:ATP-binding protein [uncultured Dubosiella sp.]|uniref:ATP-binding protein n=1 Tax=uncultured Dubosiella sp. TaxID=1937011 RepID=UPI0025B2E37C|nr:DUF4143 domain-containing protein [uncultured Dubosiella sp.]
MKDYKPRVLDHILEKKLLGKGAVLIEGPKWCGKTTTAEQIANSVLYLADPTHRGENLHLVDIAPTILLEGDTPRLIDEWQIAPKLWDAVRFEVDHRNQEGQFILTGSAVPADSSQIEHTGTGRFTWLTMYPMSLFESGESNGAISLAHLFDTPNQIFARNSLTIQDLTYLICRGGWPRATFMNPEIALEQAYDYYEAIVHADISRVDGIQRNPERVKKLMRAYARHSGQQVSLATLRKDMLVNDTDRLDTETINSYISALKKIFVIEDSESWNPNLRSKAAIRSSDTRYFIDPSIAAASLGIGPNDLLNDLKTLGFLFETLCIRDLRVYASALNGKIYHYRDSYGLECDAVLHLRNGSYGLIEIKLGGDSLIEEGAKNLLKLADTIDTTQMKSPSFLMVLTGTGSYAYRREDGVYVVPIGCLKD